MNAAKVPLLRRLTRWIAIVFLSLILLLALAFRLIMPAWAEPGTLAMYAAAWLPELTGQTDFEESACEASVASSLLKLVGLSQCGTPTVSHTVGELCVTFEEYCSEQSMKSWLQRFIKDNPAISLLALRSSGATLMGTHEDISWRLHAVIDELSEQEVRVLFSALRQLNPSELNRRLAGSVRAKHLDREGVDDVADAWNHAFDMSEALSESSFKQPSLKRLAGD